MAVVWPTVTSGLYVKCHWTYSGSYFNSYEAQDPQCAICIPDFFMGNDLLFECIELHFNVGGHKNVGSQNTILA